jgi:crotonobetainyl-CoA:carnitine CoA-transferase CaiB-like acyl-CoA transferase
MSANLPLDGVQVLDFGQYLAGPLAAMILADHGAHVVRINPPGGPRWDTTLNAALFRGCREHLTLDLRVSRDRARVVEMIRKADILIENFRPGVTGDLGIGPEECIGRAPRLIYCSLPGFGSDDARAELAAWEGVVMAAAGAYRLPGSSLIPGLGGPVHESVFSPLPLGSVFAAIEGVMAIVAALIARERDGLGQRIEVPLSDALLEAAGLAALSLERNAPPSTDFGTGLYRCLDGRYIALFGIWFRHLKWFLEAADCQSWIDEGLVDYERLWSDPEASAELRRRLVELFSTRPASEWEELARSRGAVVGMMRSMTEWLAEPQATMSGAVANGGLAQLLDISSSPIARPAPRLASPRGGSPLAGTRVLDLTRVLAGPTACRLLAQLGADVIKVDGDRATSQASHREPAFHEQVNRGKRSICLDLHDRQDRARFEQLVASTDVVVENFTVGAAERMRIDETSLRVLRPDLVFAYINTYGTRGPWAAHRGFAEIANLTTGITERTIAGVEPPSGSYPAIDLPRWPFTDYAAGVVTAIGVLLGLYHRGRTGEAVRVDTSLAKVTTLAQLLYLNSDVPEPRGVGTKGWGVTQRLYSTNDGTVFIGAKRSQLGDLFSLFGIDNPADLERALATRTTDECRELCESIDVGIHRTVTVQELMAPGGVAATRGLRLEGWSDEFGAVVMPGPVARLYRTPMIAGELPRPFGTDRVSAMGGQWVDAESS